MKRSLTLSLCAVALMAFAQNDARADGIDIDLEYGGGTWSLYAEVTDDGGTDGDIGISAINAIIDNIDFGTDGDAVTIPGGLGAINPIQTSNGPRDPVLLRSGGTLDIIYGQDISASGAVVTGVGVGSRDLIASGTYSGADPAFGSAGSSTTKGLFLTSATAGGGNAVDPSAGVTLTASSVGGIFGDFEPDGDVDITDFGLFADAFGSVTGDGNYDVRADEEPDGDVDITDFGKFADNFGTGTSSAASSVPEPTSAAIAMIALASLGLTRRRK